MIYEFFYKAKAEPGRNYEITYCVGNENNSYYIESYINGSDISETVFLGNCGKEKAEQITRLLAERAVRPVHIDYIISDLRL